MTDRYDWDALAPHWQLFERRGSNDVVMAAVIADHIASPALYVGAGLGTYASQLAGHGGSVIALDRSREMARRARELQPQLAVVVGDALALPFRGGAFRGVVCATGVFETLGDRRVDAYRELARVAGGSPIYVAAFVSTGVAIDRHALVAAWLVGGEPDPLLDAIAAELGDRERAAELIRRAMPRGDTSVSERDMVEAAASAKLSTRRLLVDRERGVMLWRHES